MSQNEVSFSICNVNLFNQKGGTSFWDIPIYVYIYIYWYTYIHANFIKPESHHQNLTSSDFEGHTHRPGQHCCSSNRWGKRSMRSVSTSPCLCPVLSPWTCSLLSSPSICQRCGLPSWLLLPSVTSRYWVRRPSGHTESGNFPSQDVCTHFSHMFWGHLWSGQQLLSQVHLLASSFPLRYLS